ncbi:MAG: MarR family transcriptional regulator [Gammaproteobacteria bacterium]|nr:MarR family transcriptional regulator [Gammaproteobacteria bacterium]MYG67557.1 MarR family transcriptional regulator [Gammaproteobacteria bacterium]
MIRSREGEALTALILETFRLNGALLAVGNRLTKPVGMTSARWQVMGAVDQSKHSLTVAQIARRMGLARQGVQRIVNDLVELGFVVLEENIDHKRSPLVCISDKGAGVMGEIAKVQAAWVNELSDGFSEGQIVEALELLETVRERCEKTTQTGESNEN